MLNGQEPPTLPREEIFLVGDLGDDFGYFLISPSRVETSTFEVKVKWLLLNFK